MSNQLDLDVLTPQPRTVKFNGQDINVQPPKTESVLRLGLIGQKFQDLNTLNDDEIASIATSLKTEIVKCIPELENVDLNLSQLTALTELIVDMGMPQPPTTEDGKVIKPVTDPKE